MNVPIRNSSRARSRTVVYILSKIVIVLKAKIKPVLVPVAERDGVPGDKIAVHANVPILDPHRLVEANTGIDATLVVPAHALLRALVE